MRADPFDPNDALLEIDRHHKTIVITFYIEDDPLRADDTRRGIATLDFRGALPRSLAHFVEPCLQRRSYRRLVLPAGKALDELSQCPASNNPHCSQYTLVPLWEQQAYCGFYCPAKALSTNRAAANALASAPYLAITCTPTGKPPSAISVGTLT